MKKLFFCVVFSASALFAQNALALSSEEAKGSKTLEHIRRTGELRVGWDSGYFPFNVQLRDGSYTGFDHEVAKEVAQDLGVKLRIIDTDWDGIIPALLSNKFDIIIGGMTITEKRAKVVEFSEPYFKTGQSLLLNKKVAGKIKGYQGLNNPSYTVATKIGTTGDIAANKLLPKAKRLQFDTQVECGNAVISGKAHAMVYDQPFIAVFAKRNRGKVETILEPFTAEFFGVGMRKKDPKIVERVNRVLKRIKDSGNYDKYYQKHMIEMPWLRRTSSG